MINSDVSPVIRKRTDGKAQYHHGPSRSFGGMNAFQQLSSSHNFSNNGNRKDPLVLKTNALINAFESREGKKAMRNLINFAQERFFKYF